jgi:hypothetical protein
MREARKSPRQKAVAEWWQRRLSATPQSARPSSKRPNMLAVLKLIGDMRIAQPSHRQVCYGRPAFFH